MNFKNIYSTKCTDKKRKISKNFLGIIISSFLINHYSYKPVYPDNLINEYQSQSSASWENAQFRGSYTAPNGNENETRYFIDNKSNIYFFQKVFNSFIEGPIKRGNLNSTSSSSGDTCLFGTNIQCLTNITTTTKQYAIEGCALFSFSRTSSESFGEGKIYKVKLGESPSCIKKREKIAYSNYKNGDFRGAISEFTKEIKLNPSSKNFFYRGKAYAALGNYDSAINDYLKAIELRAKREYFYKLAEAQYKNKDLMNAKANYTKLIRTDLTKTKYISYKAYYERGKIHYELGQNKRAIKDFNKTLEIYPGHVKSKEMISLLVNEKNNSEFNQRNKINKKDTKNFYLSGLSKVEKNNYQGAINDFTKAIEINPKDSDAFYERGLSKAFLKDEKGAIDDFTKAIEINPKDSDAFYERGLSKAFLKDEKGAIDDFTKAIKINPKESNFFYERGYSKYNLMDLKGALEDFNRALKIDPKNSNAFAQRGYTKFELKKYKEACIDFEKAESLGEIIESEYLTECKTQFKK